MACKLPQTNKHNRFTSITSQRHTSLKKEKPRPPPHLPTRCKMAHNSLLRFVCALSTHLRSVGSPAAALRGERSRLAALSPEVVQRPLAERRALPPHQSLDLRQRRASASPASNLAAEHAPPRVHNLPPPPPHYHECLCFPQRFVSALAITL